MRSVKIAVIVLILLIVEAVGFIWWINRKYSHTDALVSTAQQKESRKILYWKDPMDPTYISGKPGKSPMGMDLVPVYEDEVNAGVLGKGDEISKSEGEYYTCPMHPEVISKEPGDCPICGMTLVKKEIKKGNVVKISPSVIQKMGVRTADVQRRQLTRSIRTVGLIDYDETKVFNVNTKVEGWVEKLYVDYTGKFVEKEEPLIDIYSPELVNTQEEYLLALQSRENLKSSKFPEVIKGIEDLLSSTRKRLKLWDITDEQILDLEKAKEVKKTMTIYSPVKGIVLEKNIFKGGYIVPQTPIYKIADISDVWVYADIYEYELQWIKVGQTANMTLSYYPGKVFTGIITFMSPYLEKNTRTIKVRLEFENPSLLLKPDMYADMEIKSDIVKGGIAIPTEAVIHSGERNIVIVDIGEGMFEPRNIELGAEADGYYQVLNGLKEGEKVVTSSQFLIDSESRIKEAINKMIVEKKGISETDKEKAKKLSPHSGHNM
jgi:RND family efflux transporter MFP subunit